LTEWTKYTEHVSMKMQGPQALVQWYSYILHVKGGSALSTCQYAISRPCTHCFVTLIMGHILHTCCSVAVAMVMRFELDMSGRMNAIQITVCLAQG
jgi:hypothetical protein